MKKLLVIIVCMFTLFGTEAFAQRKTATYSGHIGFASGEFTYSFITENGQTIYDGPVTVKANDERSERVWNGYYSRYENRRMSRNYQLKANNKNNLMHGPITLSDRYSFSQSGHSSSSTTNFSGNYVNGVPHGRFLLKANEVKNGTAKALRYVDITYNNGVFTGAFTLRKSCGEYDDCDIKGTFTSNGEMNGTWTIGGSTYKFKNGVIIGGDYFKTSDTKLISMATKYANRQITKSELEAQGLYVREKELGFGYKNLYELAHKVIAGGVLTIGNPGLNTIKKIGEDTYLATYEEVYKLPCYTDKSFEERFAILKQIIENDSDYCDLRELTIFQDEMGYCEKFYEFYLPYECTDENIQKIDEYPGYSGGGRYWLLYYTKSQIERVNKVIEEHNQVILQRKKRDFENMIAGLVKNRTVVSVDEGRYIISNVHNINYTRSEATVEMDICEMEINRTTGYYELKNQDGRYKTIVGDFYYYHDEYCFNTIEQKRNKYDDLDDVKRALKDAVELTRQIREMIMQNEEIKKLKEVNAQIKAYDSYIRNFDDIKVNKNNIDAAIKSYRKHEAIVRDFGTRFLPEYVVAINLKNQIIEKQITKYTSTTMPAIGNWSESYNSDELRKSVDEYKLILKQWDEYCELKAAAIATHEQIVSTKSPILKAEYMSYYANTTEIATLPDYIAKYKALIEAQKEVNECIKLYNEVAANNTELLSSLKIAKTLLAAYKQHYSTIDFSWKHNANSCQVATEMLNLQSKLKEISKRTTLKDDEKKIKSMKGANVDEIIKAYEAL